MTTETLTEALELLGEVLSAGGAEPVWLVVGGGSALLMQRLGARQTKDVDVMALREWEGEVVSAYPLPDGLREAAEKVAGELQLDRAWVNCAVTHHGMDFQRVPATFWHGVETREYGEKLKISFMGRPGMILLKLLAALERDQQRDLEDLKCLNPSGGEIEEQLGWALARLNEPPEQSKISNLLITLGHADLIPRFA